MPPDLDDLLNSIREEASRESALAVYEGTRQDDLVDEEIDERILNLLGLDDTFDIDYKTYMTLLKERMAAARMTDSQIPTEETELLTDEFKRVKRKTGRFKIKTKKISVQDFQKSAINPSKLLTGSAFETPTEEPKAEKAPRKKKVDDIIKIRETVVSIKNLLEERNDQLKDSAETERSRAQKARRAKREDKLEEEKPNLGLKVLEKAVAPVKSLFDRIVSGLVTLIAGRFLVKFLEWFADPDNKEKVDTLIEFLTDFAPAILGGFLLFGTGFGSIIRKLIGVAVNMTAKLLKFAVPKLLKFVAKNPVAAAAIGVVGGAAIGGIMQSKTQSNDPDAPEGRTQLEDTMDYGGVTGDPVAGAFETGGLVPFKGDDSNLPKEQKGQKQQGEQEKGNPLLSLLGMTPTGMAVKGAMSFGSSLKEKGLKLGGAAMDAAGGLFGNVKEKGLKLGGAAKDVAMMHPLAKMGAFGLGKGEEVLGNIKEKGLGNAAMDAVGGLFGNVKGFMDEKGITDTLMMHPLFKMGSFGLEKGQEAFGNIKGFMDEKGITDTLKMHPLAKMGMFGMDKFMNLGKDPARDITGESGTDIKGAGVDTQLISANAGDIVINKEAASAVGPNYFDAISQKSGEKVTGAGPDTQMIAVRPGEIVVNKETVDAVGADHFLGLNRLFGGSGANKPKTAKVQAASGGGFVLPAFSSGGMVAPGEQRQKSLTAESVGLPKDASKEEIKSAYDEKHGEGSYDKKLKEEQSKAGLPPVGSVSPESIPSGGSSEKGLFASPPKSLEATLARENAAVETALAKEKSTGKVVGRENLPAATQKRLAEMDAKRSGTLPSDIKITKKGGVPDMLGIGGLIRGITGMGTNMGTNQKEESGGGFVGAVNKVMSVIQNPLSIFGMFGGGEKKIVDGNIGKPTTQEQKDLDNLADKKEKLKQSQQKLMGLKSPKKSVQDDPLFAEYQQAFDDPNHPLHEKVAGDLFTDKDPIRFEEFKKLKENEGKKEKVKSTFQLAGSSEVIDLNKPMGSEIKRADFPNTRSGAKAYQNAMKNMKAGAKASIASLPKDYKKTEQEAFAKAEEHQKKKESINARHAQLMKSTDPQRIADYDAKHGEGAYAKKLLGKLKNTYADASAAEVKKVVDPKSSIIPSKAKTFEGGEIKEGSGEKIDGATADRRLIAASPREYMLPGDTVQKLGGPDQIDKVVANTDPNSTPAKMGEKNVKLKPPEAPQKKPMITNLPPTVQSSGGGGDYGGGMEMAGNNPPSIPMLSNATKARNKMIYGINEGG